MNCIWLSKILLNDYIYMVNNCTYVSCLRRNIKIFNVIISSNKKENLIRVHESDHYISNGQEMLIPCEGVIYRYLFKN